MNKICGILLAISLCFTHFSWMVPVASEFYQGIHSICHIHAPMPQASRWIQHIGAAKNTAHWWMHCKHSTKYLSKMMTNLTTKFHKRTRTQKWIRKVSMHSTNYVKIHRVIIKQKPEKHGISGQMGVSLRKKGAHHIHTQTKGPSAQTARRTTSTATLRGNGRERDIQEPQHALRQKKPFLNYL